MKRHLKYPAQVKTCEAILAKYRNMLRSVLKESFRGGREASAEQLTQAFCQQGTKACKDREVPTIQQKKEREETKKKAEAGGETVTYRREWGTGGPEL